MAALCMLPGMLSKHSLATTKKAAHLLRRLQLPLQAADELVQRQLVCIDDLVHHRLQTSWMV